MLLRGGALLQDTEVNPGNPNRTFQTTVQGFKLFYIIPSTLGFKNIETTRSPTFSIGGVGMGTGGGVGGGARDLVVKITNRRLANAFVNVNNQRWYAIVRLGNFANSGLLATWTNTVFYELARDVLIFSETSGNKLSFKAGTYDVTTSWGLFSSKPAIQIKDACFSPVTAGPIFEALKQFRREQIISFDVKQEGTELAVRGFFDIVGAAINA